MLVILTCLALARSSLIFSNRKLMVTDLQGAVSSLQLIVTVQVIYYCNSQTILQTAETAESHNSYRLLIEPLFISMFYMN